MQFQKDKDLAQTGSISLNLSLALHRALTGGSADKAPATAFDAASDAFVGALYRWRSASLIERAISEPDWLSADPADSDVAGPQSAWASTRLRGCRNIIACLEAYGAPGQSLRAAYALEKSGLVGTYVSSFSEYGAVDLVSVGYPYNTGGVVDYALVNGKPAAVAMRDAEILQVRITDSTYDELRRQHPRAAMQLAPRFEGHRLLSDGGQRFVFAYPVTLGCQSCTPVGQVLMAHDFRPDGTFIGLRPLAFAEADEELLRQVRRPYNSDDLMIGLALVQRRLNGLGYEAGPVDGVAGKRTGVAIGEFQSDHGLPVTGAVESETARLLASDGAERHIRRFDALVQQNGAGADAFGIGLFSRFQQLPGKTQLQLAALANNVAGQYRRAGKYDEALEQLSRAETFARPVQSAHPELYVSVLLNEAAVHLALGKADLAGQVLKPAVDLLRSRDARFALPAAAADTRSGPAGADLAALRDYLVAAGGKPGTIRIEAMPVQGTDSGHIFTFQPARTASGEKS